MKFLHISDMHFDPINDGADTVKLRTKFINYLKEKNIIVDELFFTGDFRHARNQQGQQEEAVVRNACDFLISIAFSVIKDRNNIYKHIHIVPGNHDLSIGNKKILDEIYEKYDPYKANFKEVMDDGRTGLSILLSRFSFFQQCAEYLRNNMWCNLRDGEVCPVRKLENCSIIYINTAIASGRDDERGKLYIGRQYIENAFQQVTDKNPDMPIIVLAHNVIDDIEQEERIKIKNLIDDLEIPVVWLCGDSHDIEYNNSYNVAYITAGCLLQERGTEASFYVGQLNECGLCFEAHGYDSKHSGWEYKEIVTKRINNSLPDKLRIREKKVGLINNLGLPNKYFSGREKELNQIDRYFQQGEVTMINICQTISGLGGVGKTQLALEYGYRFGGNYPDAVWFIVADESVSIYKSFVQFAITVGISLPTECQIKDLQLVIRNWLSNHDKWLMIIDNIENFEDIEEYLPKVLKGHFIITTRDSNIDIGVKCPLDVFSEGEAVNFLKNRIYGKGEKKEYDFEDFENMAPKLVKRLGNLPLALEQAGAYIFVTKCSISEYLDILEENGLRMFDEKEDYAVPLYYEKVVNTTWNVSISNIANEGAKQLFYLCSYMDSHKIPVDFFIQTRDKLPTPLCDDLESGLSKNRIVTELRKYSLIGGNAKYIDVHQLVQEVVRNQLGDEKKWVNLCYSCIGEYLPTKYDDKKSRIQFFEISNHCESVLNRMNEVKKDEDYLKILFNMGYGYCVNGNYKKSYDFHKKELRVIENVFPKNLKSIARSYNYIGLACFYQGNYKEAKYYYKNAIDVIREFKNCKKEFAEIYNNFALVYRRQGKYKKAIKMYFDSLALKNQIYNYENNSIAETYNNIGVAYYWDNKFKKALKWHFKAKKIREDILSPDDPDLAETYNNIGVVYFAQGKYSEIYNYYEKALNIRREVLGEEHPETTMTYDNIASYFAVIKKYDEAIEYFEYALKIRLDKLGEDHVDVAATYNNMAYVYRHRNDDADAKLIESRKKQDDKTAIKYYEKSYEIFVKNFGKKHPHTMEVFKNLSDMYKCIGSEGYTE